MLCNPNVAMSMPVEFIHKGNTSMNTIKYPIHVACECENYQLYVDGNFVKQASVVESYLEDEWNATKIFIPEITNEIPKIIAFHGMGGQFSGFMNGFIMDMNNGADYTKYQEWKCMEFIPSAVPVNWYMYDYDDSLWEVSKSFGMNYQNNSYQIYYHERFGIHLNAEWLWTQNNAKTNVFCRKKDKHVQTIPLQTTTLFHPTPTTAAPTTHATTHSSVLKTTHHVPAQTAAPTTHATTHSSVLKTTHHVPAQTAAPTTHATTHSSVLKTTHHVPAQTATPTDKLQVKKKPETQNIYNIKNNIKIIISNAKVSKNIIDKHIFNMFRYLHSIKDDRNDDKDDDISVNNEKLRRELYYVIKQTHTHIHHHYDHIVEYYKKILRNNYDHRDQDNHDDGSDEYEDGEKQEKREKKEIFGQNDSRLKKTSKIIESMIKLNHYIKVIEYKIHFIKGETKYNLLKILYSLRKQYQDDMTQMLKFL